MTRAIAKLAALRNGVWPTCLGRARPASVGAPAAGWYPACKWRIGGGREMFRPHIIGYIANHIPLRRWPANLLGGVSN